MDFKLAPSKSYCLRLTFTYKENDYAISTSHQLRLTSLLRY
jgi:hypothetical protein